MANYEKLLENIQGFNIVSGILHKECIYLIAKNYYDADVHGRQYDEWDYPKELRIYMYMPKSNKKQDEWFAKAYNSDAFLRKVTGVLDEWKKRLIFLECFLMVI